MDFREVNSSFELDDHRCSRYNDILSVFLINKTLIVLAKIFIVLFVVYLFIGIAKISEIFMTSIEFILSTQKERKRNNSLNRKSWFEIVNSIALTALGCNCFELLYPLMDVIFNQFEKAHHGDALLIIMVSS